MKCILICALLLSFIACHKISDVDMVIKNNTNKNIQIEAFYEKEKMEVIAIKPFDSYIRPLRYSPEDGPALRVFKTDLIDSVNIIFDNEKIIIQSCKESNILDYCWDVERNILDYNQYYNYEDLGRKNYKYTYTITKEDYNNAVLIED